MRTVNIIKCVRTAAIILLLFNIVPAYAQFSGSVKADGALNFRQSNNENLDFRLKYTGKKFYVGSGLDFGHTFQPSTQVTTILDAKKEKDVGGLKNRDMSSCS